MIPNSGLLNPVVHLIVELEDRTIELNFSNAGGTSGELSAQYIYEQLALTEYAQVSANVKKASDLNNDGIFFKGITIDYFDRNIAQVTMNLFDPTYRVLDTIFNSRFSGSQGSNSSINTSMLNFRIYFGYTNNTILGASDINKEFCVPVDRSGNIIRRSQIAGCEILNAPYLPFTANSITYSLKAGGVEYVISGWASADKEFCKRIESALAKKEGEKQVESCVFKGEKLYSALKRLCEENELKLAVDPALFDVNANFMNKKAEEFTPLTNYTLIGAIEFIISLMDDTRQPQLITTFEDQGSLDKLVLEQADTAKYEDLNRLSSLNKIFFKDETKAPEAQMGRGKAISLKKQAAAIQESLNRYNSKSTLKNKTTVYISKQDLTRDTDNFLGVYKYFTAPVKNSGDYEDGGVNVINVEASTDGYLNSLMQQSINSIADYDGSRPIVVESAKAASPFLNKMRVAEPTIYNFSNTSPTDTDIISDLYEDKLLTQIKMHKELAAVPSSALSYSSVKTKTLLDLRNSAIGSDSSSDKINPYAIKNNPITINNYSDVNSVRNFDSFIGINPRTITHNPLDESYRAAARNYNFGRYKRRITPFTITLTVLGDICLNQLLIYKSFLLFEYYTHIGQLDPIFSGVYLLAGYRHEIQAGRFLTYLNLYNCPGQ